MSRFIESFVHGYGAIFLWGSKFVNVFCVKCSKCVYCCDVAFVEVDGFKPRLCAEG